MKDSSRVCLEFLGMTIYTSCWSGISFLFRLVRLVFFLWMLRLFWFNGKRFLLIFIVWCYFFGVNNVNESILKFYFKVVLNVLFFVKGLGFFRKEF